jgi:hypothetical protein
MDWMAIGDSGTESRRTGCELTQAAKGADAAVFCSGSRSASKFTKDGGAQPETAAVLKEVSTP